SPFLHPSCGGGHGNARRWELIAFGRSRFNADGDRLKIGWPPATRLGLVQFVQVDDERVAKGTTLPRSSPARLSGTGRLSSRQALGHPERSQSDGTSAHRR